MRVRVSVIFQNDADRGRLLGGSPTSLACSRTLKSTKRTFNSVISSKLTGASIESGTAREWLVR
jgi:hypothetical protein